MKAEMTISTPRWMVPLLQPARYKGAWGGRASGKSHAIAEYVIERCVMRKTEVVCIRESQKSLTQSVKKLIETKITQLKVSHLFDVLGTVIRGSNGSLIIFQGMQSHTAESIKSLEGFDIAWVEEAQTLSQRSLDMLRPTIRKAGSEIVATWNPRFANDPIDVLFRGPGSELLPGGLCVAEASFRDNPWLPEEMAQEAAYDRARDPDKFAHIWLGQYQRNSEARVFRNWRIEDIEAPPGVTFRLGVDFGFAADPSAALRCWVGGRNLYVDFEAYGFGIEIDDMPEWLTQIPQAERWPMVADSSRPETISYLRKHGYSKIQGAVKGPGSVEDGIEFLKSYTIVVHPRCTHLIDELTMYSYKVDKKTDEVLPLLSEINNHCLAEGQRVLCKRGMIPIERVTLADRVWTRAGWKRVLFSDQTDANREIVEVVARDYSLRCTPDHEIWVCEKGMVRADALRHGDELLIEVSPQWQNRKLSNGMAIVTGAIQTASAKVTAVIFAALAKATPLCCIARFGSTATELFPMDTTSTISTAIRETMILPTSNAWPASITVPSTGEIGQKSGASCSANTLTASGHSPKCGTVPKLGALSAAKLLSTDTKSPKFVRAPVQTVRVAGICARVYDLTVEDQQEFVAEGILVSNCLDALRYACEGIRRIAQANPSRPPRPRTRVFGGWAG